jgi:malate dehydrogenase (oxaloacetate-decarboxylating)
MVTLAGLVNALKLVGKKISEVSIAFVGAGAAGVAIGRLIFAYGATPALCRFVDINGILTKSRKDYETRKAEFTEQWKFCNITNEEQREGGVAEALVGADVCIAVSQPGPDTLKKEWVRTMAKDAILFACANPLPEIWPWEAQEAGAAIVATGRSDFPNQVNNSLGFPAIFRGALDVRAKTITDEMCGAAAETLAEMANVKGLTVDHILPTMDEWEIYPRIAVAVAMKAQEQGIARLSISAEDEYCQASKIIKRAHEMTHQMMREGFIPPAPKE